MWGSALSLPRIVKYTREVICYFVSWWAKVPDIANYFTYWPSTINWQYFRERIEDKQKGYHTNNSKNVTLDRTNEHCLNHTGFLCSLSENFLKLMDIISELSKSNALQVRSCSSFPDFITLWTWTWSFLVNMLHHNILLIFNCDCVHVLSGIYWSNSRWACKCISVLHHKITGLWLSIVQSRFSRKWYEKAGTLIRTTMFRLKYQQ